ncbi:MAG: XdhC family protein [Hyphomicrobiales bacterium]|nr:XdhC family protein [Hyphomicrobiales bacterium]
MKLATLAALNAERAARRPAVLVSDIEGGGERLVKAAEAGGDPLAADVAEALRSGRAASVERDGKRHFLNPHLPPPRLLAVGAVHITQALAPMASIAGFDVVVLDPRTAFATPERFAGVRVVAEWPDEFLAREPLDAFTAVALVTHDPKIDDPALERALRAGCFYVGALGSRKTHAKRLERMTAKGFDETTLARIRAPIGLPIGAASPAEIAVAVLAEAVGALRRKPDVAAAAAA